MILTFLFTLMQIRVVHAFRTGVDERSIPAHSLIRGRFLRSAPSIEGQANTSYADSSENMQNIGK